MLLSAMGLVERLKGAATRWGTQGVRVLVESAVAAAKMKDELQAMLAEQQRIWREEFEAASAETVGNERLWVKEPTLARPTPARPVMPRPVSVTPRMTPVPPEELQATAELVLDEARAAQERIRQARPARRPLTVRAEDESVEPTRRTSRKTARTTGRKTLATASAPRRVTEKSGFKAKRGQKHRH
jgi:hypothetical protein